MYRKKYTQGRKFTSVLDLIHHLDTDGVIYSVREKRAFNRAFIIGLPLKTLIDFVNTGHYVIAEPIND